MPTGTEVTAPPEKIPALLNMIQRVNEAAETVHDTTDRIRGVLRVDLNKEVEKPPKQPLPPLITDRCIYLSEIEAKLYDTNEILCLVWETLREV